MSGTNTPPQNIAFQQIPLAPNLQVPGDYVEIIAGYQTLGILPYPARNVLIGQMTSSGSGTAGVIYPNVSRAIDARGLAGPGSRLDRIATAYFAASPGVPTDIILVADAGGATKAVWTHTFTGPATAGGTTAMNIAGTRVTIGTQAADTATIMATEWAAAINALTTLPVTATSSAGVVTVTAKNGGLAANDYSYVVSPAPGDALAPGMGVVVAQTVQGAVNPSIAAAITAMGNTWYTDGLLPWDDSTNMGAASAEAERRFNAMVHQDLRWHYGFNGTVSQALANALVGNERFLFQVGLQAPGSEPDCLAASAMAQLSTSLLNDPSLQVNGVSLPGMVGPQPANRWTDTQKEMLLVGGCSVFHTNSDGSVSLERYVSTYTENAAGNLDPAWHDVMEQAVAVRIRYDWRTYCGLVWPKNKLAPDGSTAAQNDATVCTPRRMKGAWGARMMLYAQLGWVVDEVNQARASNFVIDPNDPNRMNSTMPYTRIGNLIVDAAQLVFNVGGE